MRTDSRVAVRRRTKTKIPSRCTEGRQHACLTRVLEVGSPFWINDLRSHRRERCGFGLRLSKSYRPLLSNDSVSKSISKLPILTKSAFLLASKALSLRSWIASRNLWRRAQISFGPASCRVDLALDYCIESRLGLVCNGRYGCMFREF